MNLSVQVFIDREDGRRDLFDPPTDESAHAGFDSWRETVWGSRRAVELGAEFLPRLAADDLYVEAGELDAFLKECAVLRDNLDKLVPGMDSLGRKAAARAARTHAGNGFEPCDAVADFRRTVAERLANIEAAARYALIVGGGVLIAASVATTQAVPSKPPVPPLPDAHRQPGGWHAGLSGI